MKLSTRFAVALLLAACVRSASPDDIGRGDAGDGTGGMRGDAACPVLFFTGPSCSDDVQPQCFQNTGGASACEFCDCQGRVQTTWCTGSSTRFAYRLTADHHPGDAGTCDLPRDAR